MITCKTPGMLKIHSCKTVLLRASSSQETHGMALDGAGVRHYCDTLGMTLNCKTVLTALLWHSCCEQEVTRFHTGEMTLWKDSLGMTLLEVLEWHTWGDSVVSHPGVLVLFLWWCSGRGVLMVVFWPWCFGANVLVVLCWHSGGNVLAVFACQLRLVNVGNWCIL